MSITMPIGHLNADHLGREIYFPEEANKAPGVIRGITHGGSDGSCHTYLWLAQPTDEPPDRRTTHHCGPFPDDTSVTVKRPKKTTPATSDADRP